MVRRVINASVADVAVAVGLGVAVGRFRAELKAAGPALGRLRDARHPSAGMLDSDVSGVFEPLGYIDESIEAIVRGVELCPLEAETEAVAAGPEHRVAIA